MLFFVLCCHLSVIEIHVWNFILDKYFSLKNIYRTEMRTGAGHQALFDLFTFSVVLVLASACSNESEELRWWIFKKLLLLKDSFSYQDNFRCTVLCWCLSIFCFHFLIGIKHLIRWHWIYCRSCTYTNNWWKFSCFVFTVSTRKIQKSNQWHHCDSRRLIRSALYIRVQKWSDFCFVNCFSVFFRIK